ncbi:MAG: MerR family DNA-binding protein [Pyrinomonadaceae bacterium]
MLTANVLAKSAELPVFTIRHYTKIGLLKPVKRSDNGYKIYSTSDVSLLRFITNAKELGFTLKEIGDILSEAENGISPCPHVREIIEKRISETTRQIKNLQRLKKKMKFAKAKWAKMNDGEPNGHSVCHLIESFSE